MGLQKEQDVRAELAIEQEKLSAELRQQLEEEFKTDKELVENAHQKEVVRINKLAQDFLARAVQEVYGGKREDLVTSTPYCRLRHLSIRVYITTFIIRISPLTLIREELHEIPLGTSFVYIFCILCVGKLCIFHSQFA